LSRFLPPIYTRLFSTYAWISSAFSTAIIIILIVGYRLDVLTYENYYKDSKAEATLEMLDLRRDVEGVLIEQALVLRELATLIGGSPNLTQAEFSSWVQGIDGLDSSAKTIAANDLEVSRIYPFEENEDFLGFDYQESVELLPAILNTLNSGEDLMVGPVELEQGGLGIILRAPVYAPGNSALGADAWGIVSIILDYNEFIEKVGISEAVLSYDILIDFAIPSADYQGPFFGDKASIGHKPINLNFDFPYGALTLSATPKGGWAKTTPAQLYERTIMALVAGSLLWLLGYVIWLAEKRKHAEMQLKNGIEALDDGFVMFDVNDNLIICNKKYGEIHNLPMELLRSGTPYSEIAESFVLNEGNSFTPERMVEWKEQRIKARREGGSINHTLHLGNGQIIRVSDRRMPDGSYVGLRVGITELSRAKHTAEAASKAKTNFMNVLSHELRTPMTVVLGTARLANNARLLNSSKALLAAIESGDKSVDEVTALLDDMFAQVSNLMGRMIKSGDHMMELINRMLDFAAIEAGSMTVNAEACNIKDVVDPIEQQLKVLSQGKELNFEVTQDLGSVWADPVKIRQILFNLVANAIKFTENGSVRLTVKVDAKNVVFKVNDTGPGIPKGELDRIFDPFYQVDSTAARSANGTGMGLAISRNLAELNSGTLTVNSTLEQGSCFTLTLPSPQPSLDEV